MVYDDIVQVEKASDASENLNGSAMDAVALRKTRVLGLLCTCKTLEVVASTNQRASDSTLWRTPS
jgi:hypothetical protein